MSARKNKHPNISAGLYEGEAQVFFECPADRRCKFASLYVYPDDGMEDPACMGNGQACRDWRAHRAALTALRAVIDAELEKIENEVKENA